MATDWPTVSIDDIKSDRRNAIAMGPFGSRIKTDNFVLSGVPVIRGANLGGERLNEEGYVFLTEEKANELASANAFPGDIVITHRGTLGQVGIIPLDAQYPRYVVSQSQMKLTLDERLADPYFVFYYLRSRYGQHQLLAAKSQTGVPAIAQPTTTLRSVLIPLPPLKEQQAIACILGSLDDKIELNRRMNETLEAMVRAIFKSWFVDFDPVRAKAAGQQPPGLAPHIADLFPDAFEQSELGEIPKGWRVDTLLTVSELLSGGTPSTKVSEYWDGDIKWVSAKDVSASQGTFLLNTERTITQKGVDNSSTKILPEGTTIVTARGTVGSYCILAEPMAMNQTNYGLKARTDGADYFVFLALANLVSQLKQRAYGTIFDTVTTRTFETSQVVVPSTPAMLSFDRLVQPMMSAIRQNLRQNQTLAAIRDTLLPKLISGELRVPDAERFVEETL